ncbi:MAG: hypothetical protein P9X24_06025, partial [Candidatus Hatepunaea meridiana]|nr:hypothetical protein [Candidatus Hatepunaea meridiana]
MVITISIYKVMPCQQACKHPIYNRVHPNQKPLKGQVLRYSLPITKKDISQSTIKQQKSSFSWNPSISYL